LANEKELKMMIAWISIILARGQPRRTNQEIGGTSNSETTKYHNPFFAE
jgi:hypothetical protein